MVRPNKCPSPEKTSRSKLENPQKTFGKAASSASVSISLPKSNEKTQRVIFEYSTRVAPVQSDRNHTSEGLKTDLSTHELSKTAHTEAIGTFLTGLELQKGQNQRKEKKSAEEQLQKKLKTGFSGGVGAIPHPQKHIQNLLLKKKIMETELRRTGVEIQNEKHEERPSRTISKEGIVRFLKTRTSVHLLKRNGVIEPQKNNQNRQINGMSPQKSKRNEKTGSGVEGKNNETGYSRVFNGFVGLMTTSSEKTKGKNSCELDQKPKKVDEKMKEKKGLNDQNHRIQSPQLARFSSPFGLNGVPVINRQDALRHELNGVNGLKGATNLRKSRSLTKKEIDLLKERHSFPLTILKMNQELAAMRKDKKFVKIENEEKEEPEEKMGEPLTRILKNFVEY